MKRRMCGGEIRRNAVSLRVPASCVCLCACMPMRARVCVCVNWPLAFSTPDMMMMFCAEEHRGHKLYCEFSTVFAWSSAHAQYTPPPHTHSGDACNNSAATKHLPQSQNLRCTIQKITTTIIIPLRYFNL